MIHPGLQQVGIFHRDLQPLMDGSARAVDHVLFQQHTGAQDIDDLERCQGLSHEDPEHQG